MADWQNFYIQKMGVDGNNGEYPVYESVNQWGVWCKSIPFKLFDKVKEPAKRSWYDEHGDDEYISSGGLFVEGYTMKVELGCRSKDVTDTHGVVVKTAAENVRDSVSTFLSYLRSSGMVNVYSSYTGIGRQNVRLDSVDDNATWMQGEDGWWFLIFEVTLKVNDPVTDIDLTT